MHSFMQNRIYTALRRLEPYAKTDLIYLFKGGGWLSANQFAQSVVALGIAVAFANLISSYHYGIYKYVVSIIELCAIFGLSGMGLTITRHVARGEFGALKQGLRQFLVGGVASAGASVAIGIYYLLNDDILIGGSILIGGLLAPLVQAAMLPQAYFDGTRDFKLKVWWSAGSAIASAIATIIILFILPSILLLVTIPSLVSIAIGLAAYQSIVRTQKQQNAERPIPNLLSYATHQSVISSLANAATKLETLILFQLLGPVSVAIYNFAVGIPNQLNFISKALKTLAVPRFSQQSLPAIIRALPFRMLLFFLGIAGIVGIYIISAPAIFALLFPQYLNAVIYSQAAALLLLFSPMSLFAEALAVHAHHKALYINQVAVLIIRIAGMLILIPQFGTMGLIGAGLAARIATFFYFGYIAVVVMRASK